MRWLLIALWLAACAPLAAQEKSDAPQKPTPTAEADKGDPNERDAVATVNGRPLTMRRFLDTLLVRSGRNCLEWLISTMLFEQYAEELKVRVTEEEIEKEYQAWWKNVQSRPMDMKRYTEYLKQHGIPQEEDAARVKAMLGSRLLLQKVTRAHRFTREYMEQKFREYYPKNETIYRVRLIRLNKKQKADELKREAEKLGAEAAELRKKAENEGDSEKASALIAEAEKKKAEAKAMDGKAKALEARKEEEWVKEVRERLLKEGFDKVAPEEAIGFMRKPLHYDLGWVRLLGLERSLQPVVQRLKVGELSRPVKSRVGYFLILLVDRRAPGTLSMKDVKPYFERQFKVANVMPMEIGALERKLRERAKIDYNFTRLFWKRLGLRRQPTPPAERQKPEEKPDGKEGASPKKNDD